MRAIHFAAMAAAVFGLVLIEPDPSHAQAAKKGAATASCATKHGKGFAPTESMARFQAWEIIAQTTGNWPIQTDTFKNEKYSCKPDGWGVTCFARIDVCKAG
jgi:hypothetical protein